MSMKEITPPVAAPQPCAPADFMCEHETDVIYLVNALGLLVQPDLIPDRPINDFDRLKSEWNRAAKANEGDPDPAALRERVKDQYAYLTALENHWRGLREKLTHFLDATAISLAKPWPTPMPRSAGKRFFSI